MGYTGMVRCRSMSFSIQLYREAGLPLKNTFNLNIAQYSIGIIGNDPEPSTQLLHQPVCANSPRRFGRIVVPHSPRRPPHTFPLRPFRHVRSLACHWWQRRRSQVRGDELGCRFVDPRLYVLLQHHGWFNWVLNCFGDTVDAPQEQYRRPCAMCLQRCT